MLTGKGLVYIRHERNRGISQKNQQPYDFANITFSDGLESIKMDMEPSLEETTELQHLVRGDKVDVVVDVYEVFGRTAFKVVSVKIKSKQAVG